jgi:hypothetical protein
LDILIKLYGPVDPNVALIVGHLARIASAQGRPAEAEKLYPRALAIWEEVAPDHPERATVLIELAKS